MGRKHIGVTTLTFLVPVTSSVTWLVNLPYAISYWCPIGTNRFRDIWPQTRALSHKTHAISEFIFCPMHCIALDRKCLSI